MKRNGFTLVELLAVVAILAILIAIVMPNVIESYNKAKADIFVVDAQSFMNNAMSKFTGDALEEGGHSVYYSSIYNEELKTKTLNIDSDKNYFIEIDRNGNIKRFVLFDNTYCFDMFTSYGSDSIGVLDGTKSISNNGQPIVKTSIGTMNVWESGSDSVDAIVKKNGEVIESYFVRGCEAKEHSYDDDIEADTNVMSLYGVLQKEADEGLFAKKYTGSHKDSYDRNATHDIYHFHADNDSEAVSILNKNNVLFANHCWQMIRTTDTGGVKMIYNGEVDASGKCGTDRENHIGYTLNGLPVYETFNGSYYYGSDYYYDENTNKFGLSGTIVNKSWNLLNSSELKGMYTCASTTANDTCSSLYLVESYYSPTEANVIILENNSHYSQIGQLRVSNTTNAIAYVGYKYGIPYEYKIRLSSNILNYYYGTGVSWNGTKYTLINPIKITQNRDLDSFATHHYTCVETTGISCSSVGYVYAYSGSGNMAYIVLKDGVTSPRVVIDSLENNIFDSVIKLGIDAWYIKYLSNYNSFLEETIFCNDRNYNDLDNTAWNPNGGSTNKDLTLVNDELSLDLSCSKVSDQFSINNNLAKLEYSIGLPTIPEMNLLNNSKLRKTGQRYWLITPTNIRSSSYGSSIKDNGEINGFYLTSNNFSGVRPMISIKAGTKFVSGDGSTDSPYVIE